MVRRDLLGRFRDEKGHGGILLDDLGNVPLSAGVTAVGEVADFPALKDLLPKRLDKIRPIFLLLPLDKGHKPFFCLCYLLSLWLLV